MEERNTQIVEEEIEINRRDELKDEIFENLKNQLLEEKRLVGRFYEFSNAHGEFEYDELGVNHAEADDILRKANKIRDKFLTQIELNLMYVFENVDTNSLTNIISFDLEVEGERFRVVIEVFENSFDLEVR